MPTSAKKTSMLWQKGLPNLLKHISNLKNVFGLPVVVAINRFVSDSDAELAMIEKACAEHGVEVL